MKIISKKIFILVVIFLLSGILRAQVQTTFDVETGMVFSGYNTVRIPGTTGTEFSLSRDLKTDSSYFVRLRLGYQFLSRHNISLLVAPLTLNSSGTINRPISFNEVNFPADIPLKSVYRFNSFRISYRYDFLKAKRLSLGIGLTAKIRAASISLEGGDQKTEKINVGVVPLINFKAEWKFLKKFSLILDGDALAARQGRAEDISIALSFQAGKSLRLRAGYRILEGGTDVDEVYNFALFNYFLVGTTIVF